MVVKLSFWRSAMQPTPGKPSSRRVDDDAALAVIVGVLAALAVGSIGLFVLEVVELIRFLGLPNA